MPKQATASRQNNGVSCAKKTTTNGIKMMRNIVIEFGMLKISFRMDEAMTCDFLAFDEARRTRLVRCDGV